MTVAGAAFADEATYHDRGLIGFANPKVKLARMPRGAAIRAGRRAAETTVHDLYTHASVAQACDVVGLYLAADAIPTRRELQSLTPFRRSGLDQAQAQFARVIRLAEPREG